MPFIAKDFVVYLMKCLFWISHRSVVRRKTKSELIGSTGQAVFDTSGSQRGVPAFRTRLRATICNAACYLNMGCAFLNVIVWCWNTSVQTIRCALIKA